MTSFAAARLPRDLHPLAWWVWAVGLAVAASSTTSPVALGLLLGAATLVVVSRRGDQPWADSFRVYVWLAVVIVLLRVVFRVLLGGGYAGHVLLDLPTVPLPAWATGITLLGPLTREALLAGLYDGLRLATIVVCIGAANALANPKRLLRSVPAALYEIGTALVVAVTLLPQLADSVRRVRAAQSLRAGETGRVRGLRRLVVPVLEDALDRSLSLAAGMDARGYGRSGDVPVAHRWRTGALLVTGLCGVMVGVYAVLDRTAPRVLALPMLALGCALALGGLVAAGRGVTRSRYRPDPWRWPEVVVAAAGAVMAVVAVLAARADVATAFPGPDVWPTVSLPLLGGVLVAVLGGLAAPLPARPLRGAAPARPRPARRDGAVAAPSPEVAA